MALIYKITNTSNGKAYIGFTKFENVNDRLDLHWKDSKRENLSSLIHKAMKKYGPECFEVEVLVESDDAYYLHSVVEAEMIVEHNTRVPHGYNIQPGGEGNRENKWSTPVYQYDMNGNLIRQFNSVSEAARVIGTHRNNISSACRRAKHNQASMSNGFLWSFDMCSPKTHKRNPKPGLEAARKKNTGRKRPEHSEFIRQLTEKRKKEAPVYKWIHKDGRQFTGTRYELSDKYPDMKISQSGLGCVLSGKYKSHKGWHIYGNQVGK